MSKLQIISVEVEKLHPHPRNPRIHPKKQLGQIARSIETFGFLQPLLIDRSNQIIAGHARVEAVKQLGWASVPAIQAEHLSDEQIQAYVIADNKLAENAVWDKKLIASSLMELNAKDLDFELEVIGFDTDELDLIIESYEVSLAEPQEEVPPPEVSENSRVKQGDLYQLGEHFIYCGDARSPDSYTALMRGTKADIIFTDPPYNVAVQGHVSGLGKISHREFPMASGEMSSGEFQLFLSEVFARLAENSGDGSIHFICMDWRHALDLQLAAAPHYTELKNICVWTKDNGGMGALYRSQHEFVFVYKNGTASHVNNIQLGQYGRYRTNVWHYAGMNSFSRCHGEETDLLEQHPTVKPVALVVDALLDCSRKGQIVLDNFLGSGTTLIAAEKTGRICYGIEMDPLYVDVAIRRWQTLTQKVAVNAITGKAYAAGGDNV